MRLFTTATLVVLAAALWTVTPVDAGQSVPAATGGWTNNLGQNFVLNSKVDSDGVASGTFKSWLGDTRVEGEILCISVVGDKAYMSGVMTRFDPDPSLAEDGFGFMFRVTDDGEGAGATDSHTGVFFFFPDAGLPPCDNPGLQAVIDAAGPERTVTAGNIQVRD